MALNKEYIAEQFRQLQDHICRELEKMDGTGLFKEDAWNRTEGGGGRTRTMSEGAVIEKGGVAFSEVYGPVTPAMKAQLQLDGNEFFATGVSIVLHPSNPHVPIIHMNVRYFELDTGVYWFGGGIDLTPHYIVPKQAAQFHNDLKQICDRYHASFYDRFKVWADDYFFLPHRNETRGVGGIFYDHIDDSVGINKEQLLHFAIDLGTAFPVLYAEQVALGKDKAFSPDEMRWRNLRRGRYVEFNLVHDRGTKFGLYSGGRTESILMSLPPDASWEYMAEIQTDSPESLTQSQLRKGVDWISFT